MKPTVTIDPLAADEIDRALDWYGQQRPGLSLKLLDAIEHSLSLIAESPRVFALVENTVGTAKRRCVLRSFRTS